MENCQEDLCVQLAFENKLDLEVTMLPEITDDLNESTEILGLGDRMKQYELHNDTHRVNSYEEYIVRMDGKGFSKFTKSMDKPFDFLFVLAMNRTAGDILKEFNAKTVYTHSDEITAIFDKVCTEEEYNTDVTKKNHLYNGRAQKIISHMAAFCSVRFNYHIVGLMASPENRTKYPEQFVRILEEFKQTFDARLITFDRKREEIVNHQIWRSCYDCHRNAISTYARRYFSYKEVKGKNSTDMIGMMQGKGLDWAIVPTYLKHGIYCKKELYNKVLEDGTTCVRTRPVFKAFKINFSPENVELMLSSYWTENTFEDVSALIDYKSN